MSGTSGEKVRISIRDIWRLAGKMFQSLDQWLAVAMEYPAPQLPRLEPERRLDNLVALFLYHIALSAKFAMELRVVEELQVLRSIVATWLGAPEDLLSHLNPEVVALGDFTAQFADERERQICVFLVVLCAPSRHFCLGFLRPQFFVGLPILNGQDADDQYLDRAICTNTRDKRPREMARELSDRVHVAPPFEFTG
jgi:hypothetical protein